MRSIRRHRAALVALMMGALVGSCSDDGDGLDKTSNTPSTGGTGGVGGTGGTGRGGTAGNVEAGTAGAGNAAGKKDPPEEGGTDGLGGDGSGGHAGDTDNGASGAPSISDYECSPGCADDQMCCPIGVRTACMPLDANGCKVPDLTVTHSETANTLAIKDIDADADPCLMEEGCVAGPGVRRVLAFNTGTPNIGTGDLIVGVASMDNPDFEYSVCHAHYHFNGYASYDLLDANGNVVAIGHKQSYCMRDEARVLDEPGVPMQKQFTNCDGGLQGLSRGWSDIYKIGLACQWVDITGVPAGDYFLRIRVNQSRRIYELDYDNNEIVVPVSIPAP